MKKVHKDEYRIYVLYTIPRDVLDRQVLNMIEKVESETALTDEQKTAVDAVKAIMKAEGF